MYMHCSAEEWWWGGGGGGQEEVLLWSTLFLDEALRLKGPLPDRIQDGLRTIGVLLTFVVLISGGSFLSLNTLLCSSANTHTHTQSSLCLSLPLSLSLFSLSSHSNPKKGMGLFKVDCVSWLDCVSCLCAVMKSWRSILWPATITYPKPIGFVGHLWSYRVN